MSEEIFCDSPLLQEISSIIYVEPYLYACNFNNSTIIRIDSNGNATLFATITETSGSVNLAGMVYVHGYIYVTAYNDNIYQVNINNENTWIIFTTLPTGGNIGITYLNEALYVVSDTIGIYKIDLITPSSPTLFISYTSINYSILQYITTDTNNNFYITEITDTYTNGDVLQYDSLGNLINTNFISNVMYSTILFYNNNFYFTSNIGNQISQYNINGNLINSNYATGGQTYSGGGIVFDTQGNFYVSNQPTNEPYTSTINIIRAPPTPTPTPTPTPPTPKPKPPTPIYNICFRKGTMITTDQGPIQIQNIKPLINTIKNQAIKAITQTISQDNYLVCFKKNSLGPNQPNRNTFMTGDHKVFYQGELIEARNLLTLPNITKVKYYKKVLFNVLMDKYMIIKANNMKCESLDPKNKMAKLFRKKNIKNKNRKIMMLNKHIIKYKKILNKL